MKLSITLPSIYPQALWRTLENIRDTTSNDVEILVVTPNPKLHAPPMRPGQSVVWIREEERRGCAYAHTVAAQYATGDFITATADDCAYVSHWDAAAIANYQERKGAAGRMLCLGLHYGLVGTVFGIYYANFPFLHTADARELGYFDGNYRKGFTDSDFSLKVWSAGGRCEFSKRRLIAITAEDKRKGGDDCPADDLGYFLEKWGARYGRGFDTSHMRAVNIDFDPERYPELVAGFSVYDNTSSFVARATALAPPHLVESVGTWNIVWFRGLAHALPQSAGPVNLENNDDRMQAFRAGGVSFATIAEARLYALRAEADQINARVSRTEEETRR